MPQGHPEFARLTTDEVAELQKAPDREVAEMIGKTILDLYLSITESEEDMIEIRDEITTDIRLAITQAFGSSDNSSGSKGADTRKGTSIDTDGSLTRAKEVDNNERLQNLKKQFARLDPKTQETVFGILFPTEAKRIQERTQQEWNHSQKNATEDDFFRDRSSWTSPVSYIAIINSMIFDTALVDKFEELLDTYQDDLSEGSPDLSDFSDEITRLSDAVLASLTAEDKKELLPRNQYVHDRIEWEPDGLGFHNQYDLDDNVEAVIGTEFSAPEESKTPLIQKIERLDATEIGKKQANVMYYAVVEAVAARVFEAIRFEVTEKEIARLAYDIVWTTMVEDELSEEITFDETVEWCKERSPKCASEILWLVRSETEKSHFIQTIREELSRVEGYLSSVGE